MKKTYEIGDFVKYELASSPFIAIASMIFSNVTVQNFLAGILADRVSRKLEHVRYLKEIEKSLK